MCGYYGVYRQENSGKTAADGEDLSGTCLLRKGNFI